MQQNPYSPPKSSVAEEGPRLAPRPFAVWLLSLFLLIGAAMFAIGVARFLGLAVFRFTELTDRGALAAAIAWRLALGVAFVAALIGIFRRRSWGRWVGILVIASIAVASIFMSDKAVYADDAERTGGLTFRFIVLPLLAAWWIRAFGFAPKAKRYFSRQEAGLKS